MFGILDSTSIAVHSVRRLLGAGPDERVAGQDELDEVSETLKLLVVTGTADAGAEPVEVLSAGELVGRERDVAQVREAAREQVGGEGED